MCQVCVTEGRMTQEELDAALAAGDMTYAPMFNLPAEDFAQALAEIVVQAIMTGMNPVEATDRALMLTEDYRTWHRAKAAELN